MADRAWIALRVALALALMVSFYLLAVGVAGALFVVAYADAVYTRQPAVRLVVFCVVGGFSILWAIAPRRDRFQPPGPRISRDDEPDLFALIDAIARETEQAPPRDVYLLNDINAFVSQRGGVMGIGSHRVMGLGLPLMQALTVDEFTGVLAHEFGHYHAGDVALGPWIHKTRMAIVRTIAQLHRSVLQPIFVAYSRVFLRVTHAVSRRQEFIADELAARTAGAPIMISGLRKVSAAAFTYRNYWNAELVPVIGAGYLPPIVSGYATFLERHYGSALTRAVVDAQERELETTPYDTHPSLKDRIAALSALPTRTVPADERPATSLLRHVARWEREVLQTINPGFAGLQPLDWANVGERVYLPQARAHVKAFGYLLPDCTLGDLAAGKGTALRIGRQLSGTAPNLTDVECTTRGWQLLVAAASVALSSIGWTAHVVPGDELVLRHDGQELRLWSAVRNLGDGTISAEQWRDRCRAIGIDGVRIERAVS